MLHKAFYFSCFLAGFSVAVSGDIQESADQSSIFGAEAVLDSTTTTLGSSLGLNLRLSYQQGYEPLLPELSELFPPEITIEEIDHGIDNSTYVSNSSKVLSFRLRAFSLGELVVPPLPILFVKTTSDTVLRVTNSLPFVVESVRDIEDEELRDIVPPFFISGGIPVWLVAVCVTLFAVVVAWLIKRLFLDRRGVSPIPEPQPVINYVAEFKKIAQLDLVKRGNYKTYYTLLSETLRRFFQDKAGLDALELTTEELREALLQLQDFPEDNTTKIIEFLEKADFVKFARHIPDVHEANEMPKLGIDIVEEVLGWLQQRQSDTIEATNSESLELVGSSDAELSEVEDGSVINAPQARGN